MRTLKNKKGTSLGEVLFAFLIISFMSMMLATSILGASKDMRKEDELRAKTISEIEFAEQGLVDDETAFESSDSFTLSSGNGLSSSYEMTYRDLDSYYGSRNETSSTGIIVFKRRP